MVAYYLLVGAPFLAFILDKKNRGKAFLGIFFILLFLLLSFRGIDNGIDLVNYEAIFNDIAERSWSQVFRKEYMTNIELGYALLNKIVAQFNGNFRWVLVIVACLSTLPYFVLYKEESDFSILSMALFLAVFPFSMLFSGLRQAIAMGLVVPAYIATRKHNFLSFILIVVFAYLFHESALVMFAIYPVYHLKVKKSWLWFILPIMFLVLLFNEEIFKAVLMIANKKYVDRYGKIVKTGAYTMLLLFVLFLLFSFVVCDERKLNDETRGLRSILLLVVAVQLFAPISQMVMRIDYYFILFIPLLIPKIIKCAKVEYKSLASLANIVMSVFFISYFFINAYTGVDMLQVFPYVPIWSN